MSNKRLIFWLLTPLLLSNLSHPVFANEAEHKGRKIIKRFISQDNGFGDFRGDVTMVIRKKNGKQFDRHMSVRSLEVGDDGEKRLFIFHRPRSIRGTALLSHTSNGADNQWIYLPAFKRVKRISSSNKSSPFVSSEFSYEDLASLEFEKYHYQYLRDEDLEGKACFVVKMTPLFEHSGYRHQVAYIDKKNYLFQRIDYYDAKSALLKTLKLEDYRQYLGRFWRPLTMTMVNVQSGRSTIMTWTDVVYGNDFSTSDFSTNALKRSR